MLHSIITLIFPNVVFGIFGGLSAAGFMLMFKRSEKLAWASVLGAALSLAIIALSVLQSPAHAAWPVVAARLWPSLLLGALIARWRSQSFLKRKQQLNSTTPPAPPPPPAEKSDWSK